MTPSEIESEMDAQILDSFGEPAIVAGSLMTCVFESGIEIEDESGVIVLIDALVVADRESVSLGQTVSIRDRDYTINRFLNKEGTLNRYQLV